MGFVYKKFQFEEGEVVDADKLKDNFKLFIHELNGNLDRENLPEDAIANKKDQCTPDAFTQFESKTFPSSNISFEGKGVEFIEITSDSFNVPVDSVCIVHCGFTYNWNKTELSKQIDARLDDMLSIGLTSQSAGDQLYDNIGEFFVDFVLKVNGETICEAPKNSLFKAENSLHLTGALPISAGTCTVSLQARQYRLIGGSGTLKKTFQIAKEYYIEFSKNPRAGTLITEVKRR